jgi:inhibitor of KinA sporulation pathway (predicted exonuclease)
MRKGKSIGLDDLEQYKYVLCLDTEFTCWENSQRDSWPNPDFPAEILQIGMVAYDNTTRKTVSEYVSFVRPVLNRELSDYCKNLLRLSQQIIDQASSLPVVVTEIENYLLDYRPEICCFCSFGPDLIQVAQDTVRQGLSDPFDQFAWLNLQSEASKVLSMVGELPERIDVRSALGLTESLHRHDALDDARDVKLILDPLYRVYSETTF